MCYYKYLPCLLLCLLGGVTFAQQSTSLDLVRGNLLHFDGDGFRTDTLFNLSPNRLPNTDFITQGLNHGTGKEQDAFGAVYLNQTEDGGILTKAPQTDLTAVSLWFRAEGLDGGNILGYAEGGWRIGLAANGKLDVSLNVSPFQYYHYQSPQGFATSAWHHVIVSFSGTEFQVWVDGTKMYTSNQFQSLTSVHYASPDAALFLGELPGSNGHFIGLVDEVKVFNRSLSIGEIRALYEADNTQPMVATASVAPGLVFADNFNDNHLGNHAHTNEHATNGNYLVAGQMVGRSGQAVKLRGNHLLDLGEKFTLPEFTVSLSVLTHQNEATQLLYWTNGGGLEITLGDSLPGQVTALLHLDTGILKLSTPARVNDGNWHQISCTFDGATFALSDGSKRVTVAAPSTRIIYRPGRLIIGGSHAFPAQLDARIDDLIIYNRAVSETQATLNAGPSYLIYQKRKRLSNLEETVCLLQNGPRPVNGTMTNKVGEVLIKRLKLDPFQAFAKTFQSTSPSSIELNF